MQTIIAVGDGVTDDTAAINAALSMGGWLYLPPGTYLTTDFLVPAERTRLTLDPRATILLGGSQGGFFNGVPGTTSGPGGYGGRGHILIEGGTIDALGVSGGPTICGISVGHGEDITIRDIEIRNISGVHAIEVNSSRDVLLDNVRAVGFVAKPGDTVSREAFQIDGAFDTIGFGFGPYDQTVCDDVRIERCRVDASDTLGAWPRAVGSHGALDTSRPMHQGISVTRNTFVGTLDGAVRAWFWTGSDIINNRILNSAGEGVTVQRSQHIDVTGNRVFGSGRSGVYINDSAANVNLRGNTVIGSGTSANNTHYGIRVSSNCGVIDVIGNKVRRYSSGNNAKYGFSADSTCSNVLHHTNDFRSSGVTGSIDDNSLSPVTSAADAT